MHFDVSGHRSTKTRYASETEKTIFKIVAETFWTFMFLHRPGGFSCVENDSRYGQLTLKVHSGRNFSFRVK
jgi:hypothetical protein